MLYRKINSCLLCNSQTNVLNKFLQGESLGAVLFQPVYGANFLMHPNLSRGFSFELL